ncbi:hypothetical protein AB0N05_09680 [Nocardia sp. NPDC051030]
MTLKQAIPWFLPILVLALAATGASGFRINARDGLRLIGRGWLDLQ